MNLEGAKVGDEVVVRPPTWSTELPRIMKIVAVSKSGQVQIDGGKRFTVRGREIGASNHGARIALADARHWTGQLEREAMEEELAEERERREKRTLVEALYPFTRNPASYTIDALRRVKAALDAAALDVRQAPQRGEK